MSVRLGRISDLAAVLALERAVPEAPHWSEEDYINILRSQTGISEGQASGALKRCLIVWVDEPRILGFAVGMTLDLGGEAESQLENIIVGQSARCLGIGQSLCEAILAWCRQNGAAIVELEVRASNGGAIRLYDRLGFRTKGRRSAYYRTPTEDAVLLWKLTDVYLLVTIPEIGARLT